MYAIRSYYDRLDHVGFRNNNQGKRARLDCDSEVTLQPRDIEVPVRGRDDEQGVDIGRNQLDRIRGTRGASLERTEAIEHTIDPRRLPVNRNNFV